MEEGEVVVLLCIMFYFCAYMICEVTVRKRRAEVEEAIEYARKTRAKKRRMLLNRIVELDWDLAETEIRRRKQRRMMLEYLRNRRVSPSVWVHNRGSEWWESVVPGFTCDQWIENFRMKQDTFLYLCHRLQPEMEKRDTNYRRCVPLQKRVAIALWKLSTNSEYRSVSDLFGVGITTVCRCLHEFCASIEKVLMPDEIKFPNPGKLKEMATYFEWRWGLPQCVGVIDILHIPILRPEEYDTDYSNSNGWHSITLQAVVDGKGLFWNVFAGMPGSVHDSRVLYSSALWKLADKGMLLPEQSRLIGGHYIGYYILGDAAYLLKNWLMTSFSDNGLLTSQQHLYNYKTSRARVVVENAFGRLKGRWQCLLKRNDCNIDKVNSMVLTCCVLHNLCESNGEEYREEWNASVPFNQPELTQPASEEVEGVEVREGLMCYLNTL